MNRILAVAALLVVSSGLQAAEKHLREISWIALRDQGALPLDSQVQDDGSLLLTSKAGEGLSVTLVEIPNPGITRDRYVVRGRVRYRGVGGNAYLEMWNWFADGSHYFTRTLADAGPLQRITGTSDWRDFGLYFDATGAKSPPEKLTVGLVLPESGEVSISNLTLVDLDPVTAPRTPGFWGGVAGSILGLSGALLGLLAGAGRARAFVLAGLKGLMAVGVVGIALGLIGLYRQAPYGIFYPLLLVSAIALAVPALSLPGIRKRYEELELRRMRALDV